VGGGGEEPGVACPPGDGPGVVVMHLAAQHLLPPWALLRGSDGFLDRRELGAPELRQIDEPRGAQAERTEDALVADPVERGLRHQLHQLAEQQEAEVAVDAAGARRTLELLAMDLLVRELARAPARWVV